MGVDGGVTGRAGQVLVLPVPLIINVILHENVMKMRWQRSQDTTKHVN
jgi:hypothetical protein